jgi:general secretion pathway protein G
MRNLFRRRRATARVRGTDAGFSLLEVLITLVIIALVATLVGPRLLSGLDRSKTTTAALQSKALKTALDTMRLDLGRYPTAEEGLSALVVAPANATSWQGPYIDNSVPDDPWGRPYIYIPSVNVDEAPRIGSFGSDGREGGSGSALDVYSGDPVGGESPAPQS